MNSPAHETQAPALDEYGRARQAAKEAHLSEGRAAERNARYGGRVATVRILVSVAWLMSAYLAFAESSVWPVLAAVAVQILGLSFTVLCDIATGNKAP